MPATPTTRGIRCPIRNDDMLCASKVSVCGLWTYGIPAALVVCVLLAGIAYPVPETAGQDAAVVDGASEDQFDSPEAIISRFDAELGRLASGPGIPSPNGLAQQAEANKTCAVATLPDPGKKLDAETIYMRARAGVVIVGAIPKSKKQHHSQPAFATGFVIHKDGVIVSNAHVLEAFRDMKAVGVMTSDGRVFPVKAVLAADRLNDAAVLKVEATDLTPLPLAKSAPVGATVYCLSHPLMNYMGTENGFFAFTQGIVSGRYRTRLMGETLINVLTITADYAQGSSGGPILNEHGAVVGMVCETLTISDDSGESQMTWKFSRPSSSILPLLRGMRPGRQPGARHAKVE
jgi:serine protease Do